MAPEQERGEAVDVRADVFALGQILRRIASSDGKRVPRQLRAIVAKATAADIGERYADAQALAGDVARHLDGEPVTAYRENVVERAARWLNRNRALVAMILAYLIMRVLVFFFGRT
jgi:serine/threonine-protein kinase